MSGAFTWKNQTNNERSVREREENQGKYVEMDFPSRNVFTRNFRTVKEPFARLKTCRAIVVSNNTRRPFVIGGMTSPAATAAIRHTRLLSCALVLIFFLYYYYYYSILLRQLLESNYGVQSVLSVFK